MLSMSKAVDAVTELILETFRLNGSLLAAGDDLVAPLGLTSARWQVLGAVALSPVPLTVSQIARNMGLTRQSVQRLVNEMAEDGVLRLADNPEDRRSILVERTARGRAVYAAAAERQAPWATRLARGCAVTEIEAATALLKRLRGRLEEDGPGRGG
jgi:DNA-binding MarR family transcriptional regulator